MEAVLRGFAVYVFLLVVFRLAGSRTLSQATTFDLVLLLIISETIQEAITGGDPSITYCFLLITTLMGLSVLMSILKHKFHLFRKWMEDEPLIVFENGRFHPRHMTMMRVEEEDILAAARSQHGLDKLAQVKYAIVETNGDISVIPAGQAGNNEA